MRVEDIAYIGKGMWNVTVSEVLPCGCGKTLTAFVVNSEKKPTEDFIVKEYARESKSKIRR